VTNKRVCCPQGRLADLEGEEHFSAGTDFNSMAYLVPDAESEVSRWEGYNEAEIGECAQFALSGHNAAGSYDVNMVDALLRVYWQDKGSRNNYSRPVVVLSGTDGSTIFNCRD